MKPLPLFPVTTVGSWPRPPKVLRAQKQKRTGAIDERQFDQIADQAVLDYLELQEAIGLDIVTDGELRRDNFYSFVAEKLEGVRLMTLSQMLDLVEDKAGFERILQTLDVPAYSISNPTCTGRIERRQALAVEEYAFLKKHTDKPIKIPLPGPYLLTRAMFVREASQEFYPTKEDLGEDIVGVLREEVQDLVEAGVDFIQFDEPVLTEVVFTQGLTRTFMCASLSAKKDPAEELEFAVSLLNRVVEGCTGTRTGLHICRGNWSRNESTLLSGSYHPLADYLKRLEVRQLVLEYATARAGDLIDFGDKELGLGVVNPRTDAVETVDSIVDLVERALELVPADRLFLNPDCGFGTFSNRPINESAIAVRKLEATVQAGLVLRSRHTGGAGQNPRFDQEL